jgi:hypothetical protein
MEKTRFAKLVRHTRCGEQHGLELELLLSAVGYAHYQRAREERASLPADLAQALASGVALPLGVVVDISETEETTGTIRDGAEEYTVTTGLRGPIRVVGLMTTVEVNVERPGGGRDLYTSWVGRNDKLVPAQHLRWSRPVGPWREAVEAVLGGRPGPRLADPFEQRIVETIAASAPALVAPDRGGYTRLSVELRGLDLPWVPRVLRDAPGR